MCNHFLVAIRQEYHAGEINQKMERASTPEINQPFYENLCVSCMEGEGYGRTIVGVLKGNKPAC
jgi:hypothetical protein